MYIHFELFLLYAQWGVVCVDLFLNSLESVSI